MTEALTAAKAGKRRVEEAKVGAGRYFEKLGEKVSEEGEKAKKSMRKYDEQHSGTASNNEER